MRLRRITRSPIAFWAGVAVLAIITWSVVAGIVGRAQAQADRFGSVRLAVVAARAVPMGEVVEAGDLANRDIPAAFLPEGWLGAPGDAVGRTVVAPLFPGQPVVKGQLAPDGLVGVAALLPPASRAVAVPTGAATAPLRKGDVVDVLATFETSDGGVGGAGGQEPTFPVATNALVVDVGSDAATVAVGLEEAKRVAFAVARGTVTLVVGAPGNAGGQPRRPPDPGGEPAQRAPVATSTSTPRPTAAR